MPSEQRKNLENVIRGMTGKNKISVNNLKQMNKISDLINKCKSNGSTEDINDSILSSSPKKIKSKLVTIDPLYIEQKQISNIEKEF